MKRIETLCVYCGSSKGKDPRHAALARGLGGEIAARGISLVYGAGGIGLMTEVADAVLAANGHVVGVIPHHLAREELQHSGLSETIVVDSMHQRKEIMFKRADAFVVLPGGLGTLDEFFEILTWRQIGLHDKPVVILESGGYWAPLRALLDAVVAEGFAPPSAHGLYHVADSVAELFKFLEAAPPPEIPEAPERF
ncbi:MAG: TIGR00730 family Rossman fold protein [Proteobacteria bacterium]|nr:TIGR00730 family Rossman fold protein [Pseudomonadota bacterium]MDA1355341.1 TIGR00730 family Rossman fold protein [Pseudomonadota bacterium]